MNKVNQKQWRCVARMRIFLTLVSMVLTEPVRAAARAGDMEVSLIIPYFYEKDVDFKEGASVDLASDPGLGFGFTYYYSNNLAAHWDMTFNSISYDAVRVLDDPGQTQEKFSGHLDSFTMRLGADYYFMPGKVSPFVSASLGWNFLDSNIVSGMPGTVCWWDPWWGYICDTYVPTYSENSFVYVLGAGVKFDMFRNSFIKAGYYVDFIDFDEAKGTEGFGSLRLELGFRY